MRFLLESIIEEVKPIKELLLKTFQVVLEAQLAVLFSDTQFLAYMHNVV